MRISLKHWLRLRRDPWRRIFYDAFKRWRADKMEPVRMTFDGLTAEDVVMDIGGYEGNWADDMHRRYGCTVHVFEPHPVFTKRLEDRFAGNDKIIVHGFALGGEDGMLNLSDAGDASSAVSGAESSVQGPVHAVRGFFEEFPPDRIAVAKINIEGGEYDLLPALIDAGAINRIEKLQVQFHLYSESDIAVREDLRQRLAQSHDNDWNYPFVWEQWSLNR